MLASRLILSFVSAMCLATVVRGQAAVEYAAKSSAVSAGASGVHLGACPLDSLFIPCVKQFYPAAFYSAIVGIGVALVFLLLPKSRV